jgi:two-component system sensor histidine kinase YesM
LPVRYKNFKSEKKPRSLALTHSRSFFLLIVLPTVLSFLFTGFLFRKNLLDTTRMQLYDTIDQTILNIDREFEHNAIVAASLIHDKNLMKESLAYCAAENFQQQYQASREIDTIMDNKFLVSDLNGSFYLLFGKNRRMYISSNCQNVLLDQHEIEKIVEKTPAESGKVFFIDGLLKSTRKDDLQSISILVAKPPADRGYVTDVAALVLTFDSESINNFFQYHPKRIRDTDVVRYIAGKNGKILSSTVGSLEGLSMEEAGIQLEKKFMLIARKSSFTGWTITDAVPIQAITGSVDAFFRITVLFLIAIIGLFLVYNVSFFHEIVRPFTILSTNMEKISEGDFSARVPDYGYKEFNELSDSFNIMAADLNKLTQQIKKEQKERLKSEIQALRFQLNPHFMCNTLNTIRMMAELSNHEAIAKMTGALIYIMEDNLRGDSAMYSLKHEITNLEHYVYLMQVRYGKTFNYFTDINPDLYKYKVPSMILQPLVENAILHGIRSLGRTGTITVSAVILSKDAENRIFSAETGKVLKIEVRDDGIGITPDKLEHLFDWDTGSSKGLNHIGLAAVRRRIILTYGGEYTLTVASFPGEGTVVTIYIPAQEFTEADELPFDENKL